MPGAQFAYTSQVRSSRGWRLGGGIPKIPQRVMKDSLGEELLDVFNCSAGITRRPSGLLGKLAYTINHLYSCRPGLTRPYLNKTGNKADKQEHTHMHDIYKNILCTPPQVQHKRNLSI